MLWSLRRALVGAAACVSCVAPIVNAQQNAGVIAHRFDAARAESANTSGAFLLEAAAGSLGSLAGIGIVALSAPCGTDDLACVITKVGAGGVLGAVGATIGTTLMARHTGSRRSVPGAAVGAVVGTGVGLGVHYLLNRESDRNLGDKIVVPIFVVSQGVLSAIGSKLLGR